MSIFDGMDILVTDHAVYQFALRFHSEAPTSQRDLFHLREVIEHEVRDGLGSGRFSSEKPATLFPPSDPRALYVWTAGGQRIFAVRHDESPPRFVVTTTMRAERAAA